MGLLRSSALFFRKLQRSEAHSDDLRPGDQESEAPAKPVASPRTDEAGQSGDSDGLNSSQQGRPTLDADSNEQATNAFDEADALFGRRTGAPESKVTELGEDPGAGVVGVDGIVAPNNVVGTDKFATDDTFGAEKEPERFDRAGSSEPVAQGTGDGVADQTPALMDEMADDYDDVPVTSGIEGEMDGQEPEQLPHEPITVGLDDLGDGTAEALLPIEDTDASFDM